MSAVGARPQAPGAPPAGLSATRSRLQLLLGERRGAVAALASCSILSGFTEAGVLALIAQIAATLVGGKSGVHSRFGLFDLHTSIDTLFVVAIVLALLRLALQAPLSILPARIAADVQRQLRTSLFHAFTRASWEVQSSDREGHLQEIMTSQVMQATSGALQATTLITALFTFLVLMISALALNVAAAASVLVAALALFAALRPLRSIGMRRARALSKAQIEYAGGIGETIRVAEETHVFGVGAAQRERIDRLVTSAREFFYRTQLLSRLIPNLYQSLIYLLLLASLIGLYAAGSGHAASLGAVVLLLVRAGSNGQQVQSSYQGLQQSLPFIERLQGVLRRYEQSCPRTGDRPLQRVRTLAFERVSFAYRPERPVLTDVSFEVDGGETIGVIGPSGAGKSTLVQILLQLRFPAGGRYLVNGVPAEQIAREDWHRCVAYVPQEPRLVHASVADNIRYFRALDDAAVERAARLARIHEDVMSWPHGYQTIVGPRADAVSGGQQQRICLARALAGRPQAIVLDEPTSALDPHSEMLIQESLVALKHELTLFIVAHRMSTLDICDRVMVIVGGRLQEFDTLVALRTSSAYYRSATARAAGGAARSGEAPSAEPQGEGPAEATHPSSPSPLLSLGRAPFPRARAVLAATPGVTAAMPGVADSMPGAPAATPGMPDFFIAGHPKCGTTALYEMLRAHPQIYMPAAKEPWFFASELHERTPPRPGGTPRTLAEYLALFADARPGQRVGEASALYLWSRTAAQRIAQDRPDARIVAILREPASFLRSLHLQFVQTYVETEGDLRKALALEDHRRRGERIPPHSYWPRALLYSEHVRYVEQLRRFHAVFPREQVLVLIYDDFRAANEATVRRVLRFLDVEETVPVALAEANPSVRARSQRLHELLHAVTVGQGPASGAAKATIKAVAPRRLRRGALHAVQRNIVFTAPGAPDEALMSELRERYRGEVAALSEYIDRDLVKLWGYDRPA
ncbi:MAG TPA: ATP-binding cassette domain-containing protein [Solirubrobacteraceae bacterium]|jgi:ATP-binding cassette subfamily B protein|nr:ATP-binding cassette domain-containing protein [Solirubrobacteraceae bacterium]